MLLKIFLLCIPGFGGQIDFVRGAALSLDGEGKPIIACTSTTDEGISRVVPVLKEGKYCCLITKMSVEDYCYAGTKKILTLLFRSQHYEKVRLSFKDNLTRD
jgi:hypothetical protein